MIRRLVRPVLALSLGFGLLAALPGCVFDTVFFQQSAAQVIEDAVVASIDRVNELEAKADSEGLTKAEKKELKALKKIDGRTEGLFAPDASVAKQAKLVAKLINDLRKANSPDENVRLEGKAALELYILMAATIQAETDARQTDLSEKQNKRIDQLQSKASKASQRAEDAAASGDDKKAEKLQLKATKLEAKAFDRADKLVR